MQRATAFDVPQLAAVIELLDLKLENYRGCLIRKPAFDSAAVDRWLEHTDGDVQAVEAVMNHVHLYDVVEPYADAQLPQLESLGRQLAQLWRDVVATRYPEHGITVTFATEPDEYGPTLSLYREV